MNWDFVKIVGIPNIGDVKLPDQDGWEDPTVPYPLQAYDQAFIVEGCYERFKGIQARPTGFVAGDEKISNAMRSSNMLHSASEIRRQIGGISWIDPTKQLVDKGSFVGPPSYDDLYLREPFVTTDDITSFATGGPPTKQALINVYKDLKRMWRKSFPFYVNTDNLKQNHSNLQHPQAIVEGCGWAYCNNKAGRSDFQDSGYFSRTQYPGIKLEGIQIEDDRMFDRNGIKVLASYNVLVLATDETHPQVFTQYWHNQWFDGTIAFDHVTGDYYVAMDESAWSSTFCKNLIEAVFGRGLGEMTNYTDDDGYVYDRTIVSCTFGVSMIVMDYNIKTKF